MSKKLKGRALARFEAERDIWQEVLDGVGAAPRVQDAAVPDEEAHAARLPARR